MQCMRSQRVERDWTTTCSPKTCRRKVRSDLFTVNKVEAAHVPVNGRKAPTGVKLLAAWKVPGTRVDALRFHVT